jgi:hypothetical protein
MTHEKALELASDLGCLKGFPGYNLAAVNKIAENLAQWCKTPEQGRRLVHELTSGRFSEWPGPGVMRDVCDELFPPDEQTYVKPEWMVGPPPKIECAKCDDTGASHDLRFNWARCTCAGGQNVEQSYLDQLNALTQQSRELRERAKANSKLPTNPNMERIMREVLETEHALPAKEAEAVKP